MKTQRTRFIRHSLLSLGVMAWGVSATTAAMGGKPAKPGDDDPDGGALRIPVSITFDDSADARITDDGVSSTYSDGELKGRVAAWLGGNTAPEQILLDTNTSRKADAGRKIQIDLEEFGYGTTLTEVEFATEWNIDFQGMVEGEQKAIGAQFIVPSVNDKNQWRLVYGDTAPEHSEPSGEGVPNSEVQVLAISDDDDDGSIDQWLIWADASVNACLIRYVNWAPQPLELVHAPFAIWVQKME